MRSLAPTLVKSGVFVAVTVLASGVLLGTISSGSAGGTTYRADFTDATGLSVGDDVRMAGVRVGVVKHVGVLGHDEAEVTFTVQSSVKVASTVSAAIRYRNLVGQRYLALDQGAGSPDVTWPATTALGTDRTTPGLDLTMLFNGFQPLFQALDPSEVNDLSYEIVQIFQGEGTTVTDLLTKTASLTQSLADKDAVIGQVIDNLNVVLGTVAGHSDQLGTTLTDLQELVSGLAADRQTITDALPAIADLTTSVGGLLTEARAPLATTIESLGALSNNLSESLPVISSFISTLPTKINEIGRTVSYGSWVNGYVCTLTPVTGGTVAQAPSAYLGGIGVQNPAARCQP